MIVTTRPNDTTTTQTVRTRTTAPATNPADVIGHDPASLQSRSQRGPRLQITQAWSKRPNILSIRLALLIPLFLFSFSMYQNLTNMDTVDFHRDEARWINRAYFLGDLIHPFSDTWSDYYITQGQPPLGNYLMGLGLLAQGRDLETNRVWDFHYDDAWNIQTGAMPDPADLNAGRRTNAVVGALVVVCVYALASRLTNRVGGFIGALFLSVHPLHLRLSSQALSDELLALLLMGSFLMAWRFTRRPSLGNALVLGALLGLGGAAKLSPLLLSLPLAGFGFFWMLYHLKTVGRSALGWNRGRFGWLMMAQPAIAFATFVVANPYLWSDPIGRTLSLANFRRSEMDGQSSAWPIAAVENPLVALQRTGRRFNQDYSSSIRVQDWLGDVLTASWTPLSLDVIAMVAGVVILIALVVKRGFWSPTAVTAMLMAASSAAILVGMGVDFYRYFLPLLIVFAVCVGITFGTLFELAQSLATRIREHRIAQTGPPNQGTIASKSRL